MNSPDTKDSPMTMPTFEVVVWIKKTDAFEALRDELIGFAFEEPDESTEDEGVSKERRLGRRGGVVIDPFGHSQALEI